MRLLVHYDRPEIFLDLIRERLPDLALESCRSYAGLAQAVRSFRPDTVFTIKFEGRRYPREALLDAADLRWIHVGGVGVDHLRPWDSARLTVTNSAGVASETMARFVLGGILALTFRFPAFLRHQARHEWKPLEIGRLDGRTLTVVGLGHTGRAVARLARAAGLRVLGLRAHPAPEPGVERVFGPEGLPEALAEGDYVVVALPLTGATRHVIGEAAFRAMKPGAVLVDVSRGGVVDAAALLSTLRSGHLGGAVLDVFENEPLPPDSPFWTLDNVLITAHSSSTWPGWERDAAAMFCDNAERQRKGRELRNVVDPARGY